ncbi:phytoene desaturase family protein [Paenibacillus tarimensis]
MNDQAFSYDVAIIGGGLAGLTAAVLLGKAGLKVILLERSDKLGGRARTERRDNTLMKLGPHAIYSKGEAAATFSELGIRYSGGIAGAVGGSFIAGDKLFPIPAQPMKLLRSSLLSLRGKAEIGRILSGLKRIQPIPLMGVSLQDWTLRKFKDESARRMFLSICRLWTYGNDPKWQSAGAVLQQGQLAMSSDTLYIDGGWQTLVDGLIGLGESFGVSYMKGTKAVQVITSKSGETSGVRLGDGHNLQASNILIAAGPDTAARLVPDSQALRRWSEQAIPCTSACLDITLRKLPDPRRTFVLGLDEPLYYSVHSGLAKLSADGTIVLHVMKYHQSRHPEDAKQNEAALERLMDLLQPGWRHVLAARRYLPSMLTTNGMHTTLHAQLGRPTANVPDVRGLFIAGDWVGNKGMLIDASVSSAKAAVRKILGDTIHERQFI